MKLLSFLMMIFFTFSIGIAGTEISNIQKKIESQISKLERDQGEIKSKSHVDVPWDVIDKKDKALWVSVVNAYNYMKSFAVTERYFFMYEVIRAASLGYPRNIQAFKEWIGKENARILNKNIHPSFYPVWKNHVAEIIKNIDDLAEPRPQVSSIDKINHSDQMAFLQKLNQEIGKINLNSEQSPILVETKFDLSFTLIVGCIFSLISGFLISSFFVTKNKSGTQNRKVIKKEVLKVNPSVLPELPAEALAEKAFITMPSPVNLEEECRKVIEENSYLINLSKIKFHNGPRSPFKSNINASPESVMEALSWLLKGTLVLANSSANKTSLVEWNCKEKDGRVSVDFVIHGMEFDSKSLYMNTLVEGDASAPAHFGRSEMALEGHLPAILFKTGSKKTTISLSLDANNSQINH